QRHLLLQRPRGVDHPEQPALPRVLDRGVGRERTACRYADITWLADLRVDVVGGVLVVDETIDQDAERQVAIGREVRRLRAEPGAPQYVVNRSIASHLSFSEAPPAHGARA